MEGKKIKEKIKKYLIVHSRRYLVIGLVFIFTILFFAGSLTGYFYFKHLGASQLNNLVSIAEPKQEKQDIYIKFLFEVYDKIKENYWDNISDAQLANLYKAGAEKLTNTQFVLKSADKEGLQNLLDGAIKDLNEAQKKEFAVKLASLVLVNLNPFGRSGLYTTGEEQNLKNEVQNVNPEKNLYQDLGVEKTASPEQMSEAFKEKRAELETKKATSSEAGQDLEKLNYAFGVLSDKDKRELYDHSGIEPTVFARLVRPEILHFYIKRFSPTTLDEFVKALDSVDKGDKLNTLILDLRGNIGGSIDILPYFLGPFIGQDRYAYDFFRRGENTPFKTKIGWLPSLVRYKTVVILVDNQTQSTAEVMAATLKKYNVGVLLGKKTKGWGTIERVFNLEQQIDSNEKYSLFLVHTLTLRDDNQPIEGRGVEPVIDINSQNWEEQLFAYFHYKELIEAVKEIWSKKPGE